MGAVTGAVPTDGAVCGRAKVGGGGKLVLVGADDPAGLNEGLVAAEPAPGMVTGRGGWGAEGLDAVGGVGVLSINEKVKGC